MNKLLNTLAWVCTILAILTFVWWLLTYFGIHTGLETWEDGSFTLRIMGCFSLGCAR